MRAEYHPKPSPHFVVDSEALTTLKGITSQPYPPIAGVYGGWSGLPVYVDACPVLWDCAGAAREETT